MNFSNPIVNAGVAGLRDLYAERAITPVEACEAYLSRIAGLDGALGAYVHVDAEGARAAAHASAERWRAGQALSALDGCPVSLKANFAVQGWPWHGGIAAYAQRRAEADAGAVARLRAAGAVLLGLTGLPEGGHAAHGENARFGRTHNPWSYDASPGGSSSGAGAAVAAGLCAGALGSDTSGSVRIPASFCGVWAHRGSPGLAPADGLVTNSWTYDQPGVLARSALDCARLFTALAAEAEDLGREIAEPAARDALRDAPLAVWGLDDEALEPEVRAALEAAAAAAEAEGLEVLRVRLKLDLAEYRRLVMLVAGAESAAAHGAALDADPEGASPGYRAALAQAGGAPARELAAAYRDLLAAGEAVREALTPYAAALLPATPFPAFAVGAPQPAATARFCMPASLAALPASAFPLGLGASGLPLGGQAMAWDDATALGLARLLGADLGAPPDYRG